MFYRCCRFPPDINNTFIVSDDSSAKQLANDYGATLLTESSLNVSGLNEAVQAGVNKLAEQGIDEGIIIHRIDYVMACARWACSTDFNRLWAVAVSYGRLTLLPQRLL